MGLEVRRDEVLEDALIHAVLKKFSPLRDLKVYHCESMADTDLYKRGVPTSNFNVCHLIGLKKI